jgi:hypothetical protein
VGRRMRSLDVSQGRCRARIQAGILEGSARGSTDVTTCTATKRVRRYPKEFTGRGPVVCVTTIIYYDIHIRTTRHVLRAYALTYSTSPLICNSRTLLTRNRRDLSRCCNIPMFSRPRSPLSSFLVSDQLITRSLHLHHEPD